MDRGWLNVVLYSYIRLCAPLCQKLQRNSLLRLEEGQISVLDLKTEARSWNYAKRWWRGNVVRDMISAYDDRPDR